MTETLANGYSSESTLQEQSNEYQQESVHMVFKILCLLVLWGKLPTSSIRVKFKSQTILSNMGAVGAIGIHEWVDEVFIYLAGASREGE